MCKTHPSDQASGVCARCLRERLSALTAAEAEHGAEQSSPAKIGSRPDFPDGKRRRAPKPSRLSPIRGNPSPKKAEPEAIVLKPSGSNLSFLALIIRQWRKSKKKSPHMSPAAEDVGRGRSRQAHVRPVSGRGMSPATNDEAEEHRRRAAAPSPLRRKAQRQQSPSRLSSYAVCLSPMLRPSPGNRRSHAPAETPFSGDLKGALNRKWSGVGGAVPDGSSGQGLNRSRKLVDLGKAW